jgi:hypothetical protein
MAVHLPAHTTTATEKNAFSRAHNYTIFSLFDRAELGDDYPYDLASIQNMSLEALNWSEVDIDGDGSARENITFNGKSILKIEGNFSSGPFTTVPKSALQAGNVTETLTVVQWHAVFLYVPDGYPNVSGAGYGAFAHIHNVPSPEDVAEYEPFVLAFVDRFEVPIFLVGNYKQNWESFGYSSQDEMLYTSILATLLRHEATGEALKMTSMYCLVRENLMATTLMVRLLEGLGGNLSKGLLSEGGSKQGYARWLLGMLDHRITMIQADMMQIQDMRRGWAHYVKDWGIPPYEWANYSSQVASVLISLWECIMATAEEPESVGALLYQVWDIHSQRHFLSHLKLISITGDVGLQGMHDGTYFPLGAETYFLDALDFVEWRYGRALPEEYQPDRQTLNVLSALAQLADFNLSRWPKVARVDAELSRKNTTTNYLNLSATIGYAAEPL